MFNYNVRAYQLYNRTVVSLAVLSDDNPDWRPNRFWQGDWGCELSLQFPIIKLLDYADGEPALEQDDNPFAQVVLAHIQAQRTHKDPESRYVSKLRLVRGLYDRGWTAADVRQLFRLLDWIMALPIELQDRFRGELHRYEEERRMPYISSVERLAKEEGRREGRREGQDSGLRKGLLEGIAVALQCKFGAAGVALLPRIRALRSTAKLRALAETLPQASSVTDIRSLLR
jgi:hypothetical protein